MELALHYFQVVWKSSFSVHLHKTLGEGGGDRWLSIGSLLESTLANAGRETRGYQSLYSIKPHLILPSKEKDKCFFTTSGAGALGSSLVSDNTTWKEVLITTNRDDSFCLLYLPGVEVREE